MIAALQPVSKWPVDLVRRAIFVTAIAVCGLAFRYAVYWLTFRLDPLAFVDAHCVYDCGSYTSVIANGYDLVPGGTGPADRANWAFFPLYPLIASSLVHGLGMSPAIAGFALSNTLAVVAGALSRPLFTVPRAYWLYVTLLVAGPFSVLFSSLYTESLFVLLTILALRELKKSRYLVAATWIALLSATRITGFLMVFGLLAQMVADHRRTGGTWRSLPTRVLGDGKIVLAFLVAPLGLFAYMAFLYWLMGDPLAFAHTQRSWGRAFDVPFAAVMDTFANGFALDYYSLLEKTWAAAAVIGLALSAVLARRRRYAEAVFCALCILVSLSAGIGSMVRFIVGLAPLGMVLSELLGRWRWLAALTIILGLFADAVVTIGWFNKSMFLM